MDSTTPNYHLQCLGMPRGYHIEKAHSSGLTASCFLWLTVYNHQEYIWETQTEKGLVSLIPNVVSDNSLVDLKVKKIRDKQRVIHQGPNAINYSYKMFLVHPATHAKNPPNPIIFILTTYKNVFSECGVRPLANTLYKTTLDPYLTI